MTTAEQSWIADLAGELPFRRERGVATVGIPVVARECELWSFRAPRSAGDRKDNARSLLADWDAAVDDTGPAVRRLLGRLTDRLTSCLSDYSPGAVTGAAVSIPRHRLLLHMDPTPGPRHHGRDHPRRHARNRHRRPRDRIPVPLTPAAHRLRRGKAAPRPLARRTRLPTRRRRERSWAGAVDPYRRSGGTAGEFDGVGSSPGDGSGPRPISLAPSPTAPVSRASPPSSSPASPARSEASRHGAVAGAGTGPSTLRVT